MYWWIAVIKSTNNHILALQTIVLGLLLTYSPPVLAGDAGHILDSPITAPDSLLKKMDTLRLKASAGSAIVGYVAKQDSLLIRQWLRSEGYLDAKVAVLIEEGKAIWRVNAGKLWHIRLINIKPEPDSRMPVPLSGEAFVSANYENAKTALHWSWRDRGYLKAEFSKAVVIPDAQNKQVDIIWEINPGPLFYISDIHVEGARQYAAELAVKISRLKPGLVPAQQRLHEAMQHLADDSRYQHAMIVPDLQHATGNQVPVRITVTEAGWRKLSGDAGFSTDAGFGLAAAWVDRSLMQGNIEYALRGEASRTASGIGGTLKRPAWPAANQQVGMNIDYYRADSDGRRYDSVSGGPFWQWNFHHTDYLRLSLQAENVREEGIGLITLGPRVDVHFSRESGGMLPSRGWRVNAGVGLPLRVNSTGLWTVMNVSGRLFYQPVDWALLSPRVGYGRTLNLQGTVPKTYRQFAGGATSVRGFALDSLGSTGIDGLATGGLMKAFGGVDLVLMPSAERFSPVLFGDVAKIWQAIGSKTQPVWSVGAGMIIQTPAGPLRLDLALPLNRRTQDARFQFYLTLGDIF
ncbi:hypothetical protein D8Y20_08140 [Mariprofundus sp. EBB-1]|uniref:autotransporter assembly complex protein TamA n=1 Tax=Mariprofundus sp. EBB-1 TaxID=2650971 RepID=UPI000EF25222|nr:BamA/TamA family outer membrane protein [Mariprofundus sp. EBB-1]RLL51965.1 hypothetical protein D8Y20_08140 [Mariprofundus sp. EBB-1]